MLVRSKLIAFATLIVGFLSCSYFQLGSAELNVAISRIPGQPAVLYSGNGVTLLCIITYSGSSSLQVTWYNESQVLEGSGNIQLTGPYLDLNNVYVAAAHISVLLPHTSSYRCNVSSNGSSISKTLQVQVMDSGAEAIMDVKHQSGSIYALVPFRISCSVYVPVEVTFSLNISWLRDGEVVSESSTFSSEAKAPNSSALLSDALIEETVPAEEVVYACRATGIVNGLTVFQVTKMLPTLSVQAYPIPEIKICTLSSDPYILSCLAAVDSNLLNMVQLFWLDQYRDEVKTSDIMKVSDKIQINSTHIELTVEFDEEVSPELEGTYTCIAKLPINSITLTSESSFFVSAPAQITNIEIASVLQTSDTWLAGSDAALICTAEIFKASSVGFDWRNGLGDIIVSTDSIRIASTSQLSDNVFQSTLEFRAVQSLVSGIYYCTATLDTTSLTLSSTVFYFINIESSSDLPSTTVLVTSEHAVAGGEAQLKCISTVPESYNNLPLFLWTRSNGAKVGDDIHVPETPVSNGTHTFQVLTIFPVSLLDSGEFTCTVKYQELGVSQEISSEASNFLTVQIATPLVVVSATVESTGDESHQLTCHVQLDNTKGFIPLVTTSWFFIIQAGDGTVYEHIPNSGSSQMSPVEVVSCSEQYKSGLLLLQSVVPFGTTKVVCMANVSIPNENHIVNTSGEGGIFTNELIHVGQPPIEPNEPIVRDMGSSWVEIYWVLSNNSSQQHYYIEYLDTVTQEEQESDRIFSDLFATVSTYSAVLTDLRPATRYNFQVVAENAQGVKRGNRSSFTTTETKPTGAPQDFQREVTPDGELMFTWQPPDKLSQNGVIISYNFSCRPNPRAPILQEGYAIVTVSHIMINVSEFSLEENYTCSVAAQTAKGEGPITSLQFSLSDPMMGSTSDNSTQQLQVYLYILGPLSAILIAVCIFLLIVICWRCKRNNKRKHRITTPATPRTSPPSNEYVLSRPKPSHTNNLPQDRLDSQV